VRAERTVAGAWRSSPACRVWLPVVSLGVLWVLVVHKLGVLWSAFEQYQYGWSVPVLCLYLFWKRWRARPCDGGPDGVLSVARGRAGGVQAGVDAPAHRVEGRSSNWWVFVVFIGLSLLLLPTRVLFEANPLWRLTSWGLALGAIGITLCALFILGGRPWLREFSFPIVFFLVAVPWPTRIEVPLIQWLMRMVVATTVEILGVVGVPALPRGNVIETAAGLVGIEEACSGIRSLQASLMISLFLGEVYALSARRRVVYVFAGGGLAFLFNVGRTLLLVWWASRKGIAAIANWHDVTGVSVLVGCFLTLWWVGSLLRNNSKGGVADRGSGSASLPDGGTREPADRALPGPRPPALWIGLLAWLAFVELGTETWFRAHESRAMESPRWSVKWPESNPSFQDRKISERVRTQLKYDEGAAGAWTNPDGSRWQAFYFRWLPNRSLSRRAQMQRARFHSPDICLEGAGMRLRADFGTSVIPVNVGQNLAFRKYAFDSQGQVLFVFWGVCEDGGRETTRSTLRTDSWQRVLAAMAGQRFYGERLLEIVVSGFADENQAEAAVESQLATLITVQGSGPGHQTAPMSTGPQDH
jgi:exosortase